MMGLWCFIFLSFFSFLLVQGVFEYESGLEFEYVSVVGFFFFRLLFSGCFWQGFLFLFLLFVFYVFFFCCQVEMLFVFFLLYSKIVQVFGILLIVFLFFCRVLLRKIFFLIVIIVVVIVINFRFEYDKGGKVLYIGEKVFCGIYYGCIKKSVVMKEIFF